ncbi:MULTISPECIES: cobalamin-binding protein [Pseudomonas]|jgi:ABC-type Fe3+-hydroxamate transport system substrate-binding protein|uniref:Periplasmic binding protein n=1 Tax=Pseudomonas putida (strain W619) TaxID=390235 RepID=B1J3G2_PSEPW|nr:MULTISPECIES: cobalamin-binding protein [Pseudomonas]MDH1575162.1 cobalamin-binding protein [Pseudomonas sp. GD03746]QQE84666.1 cobalamin-binding protein [Pseudomonas putida]UTL81761.1 cobalamin-binding protein [Pseudomonas putida]HEN8713552.1 cobalamin-binding protein [Pseudomonas putida]HEN8718610.1 cobalamin-binding protein [Pseudomonas putida]
MRRLLCLLAMLACTVQAGEPLRVVSLAPSMSEIMLELQADDLLVGMLDGGERPAALRNLPSVGRQGQLDMERLLSLRPDLLLLWPGSVPPAQRDQLTRLGIATFSAEPHDLEQLLEQIEAIAVRVGRAEQGRQYVGGLRERLRQLRQHYRREQPLRVFYQVWDRPLYTLGGRQVVSDALAVCGARNIFADLSQPAPQVNVESVLMRDPQVILAGDQGQLASWKAWPDLDAVAGDRLLVVPDKGLERPSGQMIEATARLCALLESKAPASR